LLCDVYCWPTSQPAGIGNNGGFQNQKEGSKKEGPSFLKRRKGFQNQERKKKPFFF
jgi:hypothetical protein